MSHYELEQVIGTGAMGRVYRARHQPSGRAVAVKLPRPDARVDVDLRNVMLREASAAARIDHENVVRLIDVPRLPDGRVALVMELVEGSTLAGWVKRWPGWDAACYALDALLSALVTAHSAGVIHRDLKPGNLLRTPDGILKVADFGAAVMLEPLRRMERSFEGGTPNYMAPEQFVPDGCIGPWTDLYAVGVFLHALLSGEPPFRATGLREIEAQKLAGPPKCVPRRGLEIPRELGELVRSMMHPEPRSRPRFAVEVRRQLGELAHEVRDEALRDSLGPPRFSTRSRIDAPELSAEVGLRLPAPEELERSIALTRLREPRLVGRANERARLDAAIDDVIRARRARLLGFVGAPGAGKSALARFGLETVEARGAMESSSARYEFSGMVVGGGLRHALRRLLGETPSPSPASFAWLTGAGAAPAFDQRTLARWLGEEEVAPEPARAAEIAYEVFCAAARQRPIYLWLDDLGWAKDGGIELVERLLAAEEAPVLIVATLRSGTLDHPSVRDVMSRLFAHERAEQVDVASLSLEDRIGLIRQLAPVDEPLARELAVRIDQTPLVVVQLVVELATRGLLQPGTDVSRLLEEHPVTSVMEHRVEALLMSMASVGPVAETILLRAAVLGLEFDHGSLRAACAAMPEAVAMMEDTLGQAVLAGLVRPEPTLYRFEHGLVRDALLERLERRPDRARLMREVAEGLLTTHGSTRPAMTTHAAEILYRAGDASTRPWQLYSEGLRSLARSGNLTFVAEQLAALRGRLEDDQVPLVDPRRAWVIATEAYHAYYACRWDEMQRAAEEALGAFVALEDAAAARTLRTLLAQAALYRQSYDEASRRALELRTDAIASGDRLAELLAASVLGEIASVRGDLDAALRYTARSLELAMAMNDRHRVIGTRLALAERLALVNREQAAERLLGELHADAVASGDVALIPDLVDARLRIQLLQGRRDVDRAALESRLSAVESEGDAWRVTLLRLMLALLVARIDPKRAAEAARDFIAAFERAPHDEALSHRMMGDLATELSALGLAELADGVAKLLEEHRERARQQLAPPSRGFIDDE